MVNEEGVKNEVAKIAGKVWEEYPKVKNFGICISKPTIASQRYDFHILPRGTPFGNWK